METPGGKLAKGGFAELEVGVLAVITLVEKNLP
jgi:hypothetical protein